MSESYELTGAISAINQTQSFPSGFQKRVFIVKTNEPKYPQLVSFEMVKDKCAILDKYSVDDEVTVSFNIRGNEHNGKVFNSLQAWQIRYAREEHRSPNQNGARPPQDAHNKAKADGYAPQDDDADQEIPF